MNKVYIDPQLLFVFYSKSFWDRVNFGDTTEDCWEHTNKPNPHGGHVQIDLSRLFSHRQNVYAHRVAWILEHNKDPGDNLVSHTCHNPRCVNPNHLKLGDHSDNMQDAVEQGTHYSYFRDNKGSRHYGWERRVSS